MAEELEQIRAAGWSVAVHNDYRLAGESYTFWLFTKGDRFIKGEGRTDAEALQQCLTRLSTKARAALDSIRIQGEDRG